MNMAANPTTAVNPAMTRISVRIAIGSAIISRIIT